jgi:hypothetical protein
MTARESPRLLSLTRVKAGREQEFEDFIREVVVPAVREHRPHLTGQWQSLRPEPDQHGDGMSAYVFIFHGNAPIEDWDLESLFTTAFSEEDAARRWHEWSELVDGDQIVVYFSGEPEIGQGHGQPVPD